MFFTRAQFEAIKGIIAKRHTAFILSAIGAEALTPSEQVQLAALGITAPTLDSVRQAYLYGRVLATNPEASTWTFAEFQDHVAAHPIPLSPVEERAVHAAQLSAGQLCRGLGNRVDLDTGRVLIEADQQLRTQTEAGIRTDVAANIAARETVKELRSDLGWRAQDWARDWDRIAVTEKQAAMQQGLADAFRGKDGPEVEVFKRPMPTACPHCLRLHIGPDGAPRIYLLSTLEAHGTNVGRRAAEWLAVVGPVHPHCQCMLVRVPKGWGFDEGGQLVPGGKLGQRYESEEAIERALVEEDELRKAGFRIKPEDVTGDHGAGRAVDRGTTGPNLRMNAPPIPPAQMKNADARNLLRPSPPLIILRDKLMASRLDLVHHQPELERPIHVTPFDNGKQRGKIAKKNRGTFDAKARRRFKGRQENPSP